MQLNKSVWKVLGGLPAGRTRPADSKFSAFTQSSQAAGCYFILNRYEHDVDLIWFSARETIFPKMSSSCLNLLGLNKNMKVTLST